LRYHDPENWPMLREALHKMGRSDLIGNGKKHLIPTWQPAGTGEKGEGKRKQGDKRFNKPTKATSFRTQQNHGGRSKPKPKPSKQRRR